MKSINGGYKNRPFKAIYFFPLSGMDKPLYIGLYRVDVKVIDFILQGILKPGTIRLDAVPFPWAVLIEHIG
jgi:hypothetical protein